MRFAIKLLFLGISNILFITVGASTEDGMHEPPLKSHRVEHQRYCHPLALAPTDPLFGIDIDTIYMTETPRIREEPRFHDGSPTHDPSRCLNFSIQTGELSVVQETSGILTEKSCDKNTSHDINAKINDNSSYCDTANEKDLATVVKKGCIHNIEEITFTSEQKTFLIEKMLKENVSVITISRILKIARDEIVSLKKEMKAAKLKKNKR